ncbi:MAG: PAS domain-containing protein [Thalassobaculum sp.]|uniref:PAS domain-containing protein n=1 Tax=Thalassobaculum sp. TaxID=2022740 RepID=UPI0032EFF00C
MSAGRRPSANPPSEALLRDVERLTDELVGGPPGAIAALFATIDSPTPTTRWEPSESELEDGPLRFLLRLWLDRAETDRLPASRTIDALELRPALGYLMLLEPIDGGADFRYRVYGTAIAEYAGLEMTGRTVWDLPSPRVAAFFLATYQAVCRKRRPLFSHHTTHHAIQSADWNRVILPFAGDDGTVDRLLVGNVPSLRDL